MSRLGDSVGSRPRDASIAGLDPVTTDRPSGREIAIPVEIARQRADLANSRTRSDAGPSNEGEGIVCATGKRWMTRSSDLHEWRNDLGAVSARDSVKLEYR